MLHFSNVKAFNGRTYLVWIRLWGYHIVTYELQTRDAGSPEDPGEALAVTHIVNNLCDTTEELVWRRKSPGCIQQQLDLCPLLEGMKVLERFGVFEVWRVHKRFPLLSICLPFSQKWLGAPEECAGPIIPTLQLQPPFLLPVQDHVPEGLDLETW